MASPVDAGCRGAIAVRWPVGSAATAGSRVRVTGRWITDPESGIRPDGICSLVQRSSRRHRSPLDHRSGSSQLDQADLRHALRHAGRNRGCAGAECPGRNEPGAARPVRPVGTGPHPVDFRFSRRVDHRMGVAAAARCRGRPNPGDAGCRGRQCSLRAASSAGLRPPPGRRHSPPCSRCAARDNGSPRPRRSWRRLASVSWLIDPWSVLDLSTWLSAGALWGAVTFGRWSDRALGSGWWWRMLSSSLGATLATAPITAGAFGTVSLAGIVLNFLAIPLAALAVPGILASLIADAALDSRRGGARRPARVSPWRDWISWRGGVPLARRLCLAPGRMEILLAVARGSGGRIAGEWRVEPRGRSVAALGPDSGVRRLGRKPRGTLRRAQ